MKLKNLSFEGYRNLEENFITPGEEVNVIYGNNAQGKTNLLEAIWLFTGGRSFRGSKDVNLVNFQQDFAKLEADFECFNRINRATISISSNPRKITLNSVEKPTSRCLVGLFCAVVFAPTHLSLIKAGPQERRKFIDAAICQVKPSYVTLINSFTRVLLQRNALLKNLSLQKELLSTLDVWDDKFALIGAEIILERLLYLKNLNFYSEKFYKGISHHKENFGILYSSNIKLQEDISLNSVKEELLKKLMEKRKKDLSFCYTSVGPHRDDFDIKINNISAKNFGSQGQQRSAVLALKLAEASILNDGKTEKPLVLLDDVLSELDVFRQDYILNSLKGWQVFVTCCEPSTVTRLAKGKLFGLNNGKIQDRS